MKYVYPLTLLLMAIGCIVYYLFNTHLIFKLLIFFGLSFPVSVVWIWQHNSLGYEAISLLGKEELIAWYFPKGSILINKYILGMVPADWLFLFVNIPLGFMIWQFFPINSVTVPKWQQIITLIMFNFHFVALGYFAVKIDYSCKISFFTYGLLGWPVWWFTYQYISPLIYLLFMIAYTIFIFVWDLGSRKLMAWLYEKLGIHSVLFSKDKKWWLYGAPFSIAFVYGWAALFFMTPIMTFIWYWYGR